MVRILVNHRWRRKLWGWRRGNRATGLGADLLSQARQRSFSALGVLYVPVLRAGLIQGRLGGGMGAMSLYPL
jgi:hypothetical protein